MQLLGLPPLRSRAELCAEAKRGSAQCSDNNDSAAPSAEASVQAATIAGAGGSAGGSAPRFSSEVSPEDVCAALEAPESEALTDILIEPSP